MSPAEATREALGRFLAARHGVPVRWVWTDNRRVYVSVRRAPDGITVRLHRSFGHAPAEVWEALGWFLREGDRSRLGPALEHFRAHRQDRPARRIGVRPRGLAHDLEPILGELLALPGFHDLPPVAIGWGSRRRPGRRGVRVGSYRPGPPAVIRIHPVLDRPEVPRTAVASVVYHELVHHLLWARYGRAEGRRHGPRFRARERAFPGYAEARQWFDREFPRLLEKAGG